MSTTVTYSKSSPYYNSDTWGVFLDVIKWRNIPADPSDIEYQIDLIYNGRPDLLSYDLYGIPDLWWVFAVRNPEVIQDPIFDFSAGTIIFIPKKSTLQTALGF
mgnify:CR=1 FL=1